MRDNSTDELVNGDIKSKLIALIHKHVGGVTRSFVDDLLTVLRSENLDLPKSSKTLLKTSTVKTDIRLTLNSKLTYGEYVYYGIESSLNNILDPNIYVEKEILLQINIDGAELYNKTKKSAWPILGMLHNDNYKSKPFLIAIYYGHSKPFSVKHFLKDLVNEVNHLVANGIIIQNTYFDFGIKAFVCDTPARAYIKRCKGHTGFFCCERCTVKGNSVATGRRRSNNKAKKKVFDDLNCDERAHNSFLNKEKPEYHSPKEDSPLLNIHGFNIVKNVVLDAMHLLCLGVARFLLEMIIHQLGERVEQLQNILDNIANDIPVEFQRNEFDLSDITNWKATQFRFVLFYCLGFFGSLLPNDQFKHLLLLFVSCRIRANKEQCDVQRAEYCMAKIRLVSMFTI